MKKILHLLFICSFCCFIDASNAYGQDFEQWRSQYLQEANTYSDSLQKAYSAFLKKAWVEMQRQQPIKSFEQPKPTRIPTLEPKADQKPTKPVVPEALPEEPQKPLPDPPAPTIEPPSLSLYLYGSYWNRPVAELPSLFIPKKSNKEDEIRAFWKEASDRLSEDFIEGIIKPLDQRKASDWARVDYVGQWVKQQGLENADLEMLYQWWILAQMGYDIRLAYHQRGYVLLGSSDEPLFARSYYRLEGKKYYLLWQSTDEEVGRVKTYDGQAGSPLKWLERKPMQLDPSYEQKELRFSWKGQEYRFALDINTNRISYFEGLVRSKPELYGKIPMDSLTTAQFDTHLREPLASLESERERVDFLLTLVQRSFAYQTDDEQFGIEKPMSPEQTLWYTASDCEDRTALMLWLLQRYTKLPVVVLRYPTHIALGVDFADEHQKAGDHYYKLDGQIYTLCDPTYIGAPSGLEMPHLKGQASVIRL